LFHILNCSGRTKLKIKDTLQGAKDTLTTSDTSRKSIAADPLTEYEAKEPMTPAKIKEHEPTAVKREMTEKITEPGQSGTNPEEAAERARRKGMTKGTAGAGDTGKEYEQGAAGTTE
jgi:predicted AAA+ superfamily ATPase